MLLARLSRASLGSPSGEVSRPVMFGTVGSLSLRRTNSGVISSMTNNGTSLLFAMEGDPMSLEGKVVFVQVFHRRRQLYESQISGTTRTPRVQSVPSSDRPANTTKVSYLAVRCRKTPPPVKSAHTQRERREHNVLVFLSPEDVPSQHGGRSHAYIPSARASVPIRLLTRGSALISHFPTCQCKYS